jgi:hypothetical protein
MADGTMLNRMTHRKSMPAQTNVAATSGPMTAPIMSAARSTP